MNPFLDKILEYGNYTVHLSIKEVKLQNPLALHDKKVIYFSIRLKNSKKGIIPRTEVLYLFCIETKDLSIIMFSPLAHFLNNRPESLPLFSKAIFDGEQAFNDFIHNFDIGNFIDVDGNMYSNENK